MPAKSTYQVTSNIYKVGVVVAGHLLSNILLISGIHWYWVNGSVSSACIFALIMVNLITSSFTLVVCANTRWSIRRTEHIPQTFDLEDYLLSFLYLRLVIAQLGRQTADYNISEAVFFSGTGLPSDEYGAYQKNVYEQPKLNPMQGSALV